MYCVLADIENRVSKQELINLCNDVSEDVSEQIAIASEQIDNSLRGRYTLPLSKTYKQITSICIEIVVFNLYAKNNLITDNTKYRYDTAISQLNSLKNGTAILDEEKNPQVGKVIVFSRDSINMKTTYKQFREQF